MKNRLQAKGIDTDRQKELIWDHFSRFDLCGVVRNCAEWEANRSAGDTGDDPNYQSNIALRIQESYLQALYILENWDEIYSLGLKDFGIESDVFDIHGDDQKTKHIIKLNNAYEMLVVFSSLISPHIQGLALSGEDLNLPSPGRTAEFKEWVYTHYRSVFLLETYIGMIATAEYVEKQNLQLSEQTIQREMKLRSDTYQSSLDSFTNRIPKTCVALEFLPVYKDFILSEIRDDLKKSRAGRQQNPLTSHEILLRYYAQHGYEGQKCEVAAIYKWLRKRKRPGQELTGFPEYMASEEARVRGELNAIRDSVSMEGGDSFYKYAMIENRFVGRQLSAGSVNVAIEYGKEVDQKLRALAPGDLSPVMKGTRCTLELFLFAGVEETNRVYHVISKPIPLSEFDFKAYQRDCGAAREKLEQLKAWIEAGASFDALAEAHSDDFDRTQGDISKTYQTQHGLLFAKKINAIPDGGLDVLQSANGLHLVQVVSRVETPFTDEVKENILQQYQNELASQKERYEFTKKLFYEVNPYFKKPSP